MKYGFIGCGNMGGAIAKALSRATKEIMVSDRSGKAKAFAEELGIVYSDAETIAARCDRIFIAVKPHMVQEVLSPLQKVLGKRKPLLITMAAGMEIAKLEQLRRDGAARHPHHAQHSHGHRQRGHSLLPQRACGG